MGNGINFSKKRLVLLSWMALPLLIAWLSSSYLIGLNRHAVWEINNTTPASCILAGQKISTPPTILRRLPWNGSGLVTIWFDDAWSSQFITAYPILESEKMEAALSVPTKFIGFDDYMGWNQIKLLQYEGWEIASHTRSHTCDLNSMTQSYAEDELSGSLQDLSAQGLRVDEFVTPCGTKSPIITEKAQKFYLSLRTTEPGVNPLPITNPYDLKAYAPEQTNTEEEIQGWINGAKVNHAWIILVFHQVDDGNERFATSPDKLRKILKMVKESGMPVVLPAQVLHILPKTA